MGGVGGGLVLLPRFTTLCGAASFATAPLDITQIGSTQFNVWRSPIRVSSGTGSLSMYMEESLDCQTWSLGPVAPPAVVIPENEIKFFSYDVRLRWFRVRFALAGTNPMVTCWAEGLTREGGVWGTPFAPDTDLSLVSGPAGEPAGAVEPGTACKSKGTVRWFSRVVPSITIWKDGKPHVYPPREVRGYTDGKREWTWPPPGYDVIDMYGKLWPAVCEPARDDPSASGLSPPVSDQFADAGKVVLTPPMFGNTEPRGLPDIPYWDL